MRLFGWVIWLMVLALWGQAAMAADPWVGRKFRGTFGPLPPGWEILRDRTETSTRRKGCIGTVVTPECAVITDMACYLWQRRDLCALSNGAQGTDEWVPTRPDHHVKYRIVESRPLEERPRNPDSWAGPWDSYAWEIGARWRVTIVDQDCDVKDRDCPTDLFEPTYYYLSPIRRGWFVVFQENPRWPQPNKPCTNVDLYPSIAIPELCRQFPSDLVPWP